MGKKQQTNLDKQCFCGAMQTYPACCGLLITRQQQAQSAEKLMRSRYSAYVLKNKDYLLSTWHASTRPSQLDLTEDNTQWQSLTIIGCEAGQIHDTQGKVEFIACYKINGKAYKLRENSIFIQESGQWLYLSGELSSS